MNDVIKHTGPYLDATATEVVEFIERVNQSSPIMPCVQVSLTGLTRVLNDPEALIDLLLLAIGNRCANDDQIITLMACVMSEAADRFQTPITAERLARAAEMFKNATQALNQQPEDPQ